MADLTQFDDRKRLPMTVDELRAYLDTQPGDLPVLVTDGANCFNLIPRRFQLLQAGEWLSDQAVLMIDSSRMFD